MNNNVVFLDCTNGYGYNYSACNTKIEFMARGLTKCGDICYVHNGLEGKPGLSKTEYYYRDGVGHIINYPLKWHWLISSIKNYSQLIKDLRQIRKNDRNNIVILEAPYLPIYVLQVLAARKAEYKIVVISHEWMATFNHKNIFRRWLEKSYSLFFGYMADGILPISEYIIKKIKRFNKPYLKVPVEGDFSKLPLITDKEKYFLYCGSAGYARVISLVIDGFVEFIKNNTEFCNSFFKLVLVLSGADWEIEVIKRMITEKKIVNYVDIEQKVPYNDLIMMYSRAAGLIIPLDPKCEQDKARFSQKIAEYLSSGTVIISNPVGEIPLYFESGKNMLLCDYTVDGFSNSFEWIAKHPGEAQQIGFAGFAVGKVFFDYVIQGKSLHNFFKGL